MTKESLNAALYQRMAEEQARYRERLLTMKPEDILSHACEYTTREDIVMCLEDDILSPEQARALLNSPRPLANICKDWEKRDTCGHMEDIRDTIEARADSLIRQVKQREAR